MSGTYKDVGGVGTPVYDQLCSDFAQGLAGPLPEVELAEEQPDPLIKHEDGATP